MTPEKAKELRERLGLNFKEMGELIGVKHRQVRRYETGDSNITGAVKKNYEQLEVSVICHEEFQTNRMHFIETMKGI